jgi:hypothetical protein
MKAENFPETSEHFYHNAQRRILDDWHRHTLYFVDDTGL